MGLYWQNFSLVFLSHLFLYAGVCCIAHRSVEVVPYGQSQGAEFLFSLRMEITSLDSLTRGIEGEQE